MQKGASEAPLTFLVMVRGYIAAMNTDAATHAAMKYVGYITLPPF